jgi:type I restriction enzyme M protein
MVQEKTPKEGYIFDFISGKEVKETPEEIEAVQVFCKQLVEDYGYPKENIQTRPQHKVKCRPSDKKKAYPIDIAVFSNEKKDDDDLHIVVECKRKKREEGKSQLQDYLTLSRASLGVWFNGDGRLFLRKIVKDNGEVLFIEIPNIPEYGQRLEDIGKFKRKDLKPTHNLKAIFKSVRNRLAGNNVGATRDEELAQQLINLIFCKLYDERYTAPDEIVNFRAGVNEKPLDIKNRILDLFAQVKKANLSEVLSDKDIIDLDENSIVYVVGELQNYSLTDSERDVIADAFETFIGRALKGSQGQFFTPRNVVKLMVDIIDPDEKDKIIDPACGSGGFLIDALKFVWAKMDEKYKKLNWKELDLQTRKIEVATRNFRGLDKDSFLSKLAKAYMNLIGDGTTGIFCEDSLEVPVNWKTETQNKAELGTFDVVLTNPPFGEKIKVSGEEKLKQYGLAHKWKEKAGGYEMGELKTEQPPQILFIERCLQLTKEGGKTAIVLPEGTFGNPSDRYIWNYILQNATVEAIISTPPETFQPNTHFKTSILFLKKKVTDVDYSFFMGIANTCGHNKNGKEIYQITQDGTPILDPNGNKIMDDELPLVLQQYQLFKQKKLKNFSHLGFSMKISEIKNHIFIPDYYDPDLKKELADLSQSSQVKLVSVQELIDAKNISIKKGNEIGSEFYGRGDVPFIRTSDIVNWELKIDPIKCVPEEIYRQYKDKQDVKADDILFVKDGTFLIGRTALVTEQTQRIVIQSHLIKIRVLGSGSEAISINPYYLLYLFNLPIVQRQIRRYTFIQGTLSTIGNRFNELKLPFHQDKAVIDKISEQVKEIIEKKQAIMQEITALIQ